MLASLNYPNIGSIYGLEEAEGVRALVLVEGRRSLTESPRDRSKELKRLAPGN